ncbi:hypothetical protein L2E82_22912 [Cichorium intybus]|uniref:Uncharacterized protein n=1 Tax=Cichorium intybus TaxID=13427 RepID=A0ACB9DZD6_CICIN|nr:hypothetical protein L2E82_22912 [Cichorium intybus]
MDNCPLDITVISASGLKNVNLFMKMGVYVVVSLISGNSVTKQQTHVSKGNKNPMWSHRIKFLIEESATQNSTLIFILRSRRVLGDRIIGEVSIPVRELLECVPGSETKEQVVEYQVRSIRGKARGSLTFSHKFKEKIPPRNNNNIQNGTANAYVMPQQGGPSYPQAPYPPAQGYNAYQGQPQYGGALYPQPYGYNQPQPTVAAPSKSKE